MDRLIWAQADLSVAVVKARVFLWRVPCEEPVRTSFGIMEDRPAVFVELRDGAGNRGLGEVWCNFPACGAEHRAQLLESAVLPAVIGASFASPSACFKSLSARFARLAIQAGEPGPVAQCIAGIDVALWDLVARRAGLPLFRLLGGERAILPVYASGINPGGAAQTVARARAAGHRAFKLKVGFDAETDLRSIAETCEGLGDGERVMIDANQAWTLEQAMAALPALGTFPLGWLEEPLMADRPDAEWQALAAAAPMPLAAGENMIGESEFARGMGLFDVVQPDLCKWGGISGVLPVARAIRDAGRLYCPHYLGGGIGLAASAHLLAAVGGDGLLEMDCNENPLRSDLFAPDVTAGTITLDEAPGLGVDAGFAALRARFCG